MPSYRKLQGADFESHHIQSFLPLLLPLHTCILQARDV